MANALTNILILSSMLFGFGIFLVVSRKNAIGILLGIELMLNAANLNFIGFSRYSAAVDNPFNGHVFALFVIALAVAEAAVGLALIIALYRKFGTVEPESADTLRG